MSDEPTDEVMTYGLCRYVLGSADCCAWHELEDVFDVEFYNHSTPFDDGIGAYWGDDNKHLNPRRRAWVDAKIAEYEAAHASEVAAS